MNNLEEAKRVVNEIYKKTGNHSFFDSLFIDVLSEEIAEGLKEERTIQAVFELDSTTGIKYVGITSEKLNEVNQIGITLERFSPEEKEENKKIDEQKRIDESIAAQDKVAKLANECLAMELQLKKKALVDKLLDQSK